MAKKMKTNTRDWRREFLRAELSLLPLRGGKEAVCTLQKHGHVMSISSCGIRAFVSNQQFNCSIFGSTCAMGQSKFHNNFSYFIDLMRGTL